MSSFGRRNSLITYFYISSVLCLILAGFTFVEMDDYMVVVVQGIVALLAKGISIGTLATIFIYGAELFPTVLRSTAMGIVGLAARVASMIAPSFTLLVSFYCYVSMPDVFLKYVILKSDEFITLLTYKREFNYAQSTKTLKHLIGFKNV